MKITNKLNLPDGIVKAVSTEKHNLPNTLSATTLIQGIKQIILTDRHWEELEDDVSERIWAVWGQAVHSLLEHEGENDFSEQEMSFKVGNITVTGRIDNYNIKLGILCDYKTASINKIKFKDFRDWYLQGLIYAWLLNKNNFPIKTCRFIALLKDHKKSEVLRDSQYPKVPVYVYEFDVTQQALFKIGIFIQNKINDYLKYLTFNDNAIPPCSSEERWERKSKFAVMKKGAKKAIKLFDTKEEADILINSKADDYYLESRKGESVKCNSFCICSKFCNFCNVSVNTQQTFKDFQPEQKTETSNLSKVKTIKDRGNEIINEIGKIIKSDKYGTLFSESQKEELREIIRTTKLDSKGIDDLNELKLFVSDEAAKREIRKAA